MAEREKRPYTLSPEAREQRRRAAARPRGKLSAAALQQRRSAPWKHGHDSRSVLTQTIPPCKRSTCPLTDPAVRGNCSIKRAMNDSGRALEVCPVALVTNEDKRRALRAAIDGGDPSQIADLVSNLLAGMHQLAEGELASLLQEGLRIETAGLGPDGDVFSIPKVNPRAEPTLKLLDMLGASAAQQAITPKSQGERKRDEGIDELAALVAGRASSRTARERAVTAGAPPPEPES